MGKNRFSVKTGEDKVVNAEVFFTIYIPAYMYANSYIKKQFFSVLVIYILGYTHPSTSTTMVPPF